MARGKTTGGDPNRALHGAKGAAIAELLLGYGANIDARCFRAGAAGEGVGVMPAAASSASVGGAFGLGTSSLAWTMQPISGPRPVSQQQETSRTTILPPRMSA